MIIGSTEINIRMIKGILRSDIQANHAEEHKGEVNGLGLEVLLVEEDCGTGKALPPSI